MTNHYHLHLPSAKTVEPREQRGTIHFALKGYDNKYTHLLEDDTIGGSHVASVASIKIDGNYCVPTDDALTVASTLAVTRHIVSVEPSLIRVHYERGNELDGWKRTDQYPIDWEYRRACVLERDSYTCQECGAESLTASELPLHVHHRTPIEDGGSHELANLTALCRRCHGDAHNFIF